MGQKTIVWRPSSTHSLFLYSLKAKIGLYILKILQTKTKNSREHMSETVACNAENITICPLTEKVCWLWFRTLFLWKGVLTSCLNGYLQIKLLGYHMLLSQEWSIFWKDLVMHLCERSYKYDINSMIISYSYM